MTYMRGFCYHETWEVFQSTRYLESVSGFLRAAGGRKGPLNALLSGRIPSRWPPTMTSDNDLSKWPLLSLSQRPLQGRCYRRKLLVSPGTGEKGDWSSGHWVWLVSGFLDSHQPRAIFMSSNRSTHVNSDFLLPFSFFSVSFFVWCHLPPLTQITQFHFFPDRKLRLWFIAQGKKGNVILIRFLGHKSERCSSHNVWSTSSLFSYKVTLKSPGSSKQPVLVSHHFLWYQAFLFVVFLIDSIFLLWLFNPVTWPRDLAIIILTALKYNIIYNICKYTERSKLSW